jgi:hypothetical protein
MVTAGHGRQMKIASEIFVEFERSIRATLRFIRLNFFVKCQTVRTITTHTVDHEQE